MNWLGCRFRDDGGQSFREAQHLMLVLTFYHYPDHRLCTGGSQNDPPGLCQLSLGLRNSLLNGRNESIKPCRVIIGLKSG